MWYVVQTQTGNEQQVMELLGNMSSDNAVKEMFIPMFEDVRKKDGVARIYLRRLFPGYFFVEADEPKRVFDVLKKIPEFTRILGAEEDSGEKLFLPVGEDDEGFLKSLMENGLMRVSYVTRAKNGRIDRIIGPLAKYSNRIIKFDLSRRRAIVQATIFGKERKLKFGLWTDADPKLSWVEQMLHDENEDKSDGKALLAGAADIGIHPGDKVIDECGVYEGIVFTVESVDTEHRIIHTSVDMFGSRVKVQLNADEVEKV